MVVLILKKISNFFFCREIFEIPGEKITAEIYKFQAEIKIYREFSRSEKNGPPPPVTFGS
jgi:hypothetical protein